MAESVIFSFVRLIGRRCISTSFFTNFIFSFEGRRKFAKILGTILAPTTSWPWNVHPCPSSNLLVAGLPISCKSAAHLSQRSSDFRAILSTTRSEERRVGREGRALWEDEHVEHNECDG